MNINNLSKSDTKYIMKIILILVTIEYKLDNISVLFNPTRRFYPVCD